MATPGDTLLINTFHYILFGKSKTNFKLSNFLGNSDIQWCFSQVKGTLDDDVTEGEY